MLSTLDNNHHHHDIFSARLSNQNLLSALAPPHSGQQSSGRLCWGRGCPQRKGPGSLRPLRPLSLRRPGPVQVHREQSGQWRKWVNLTWHGLFQVCSCPPGYEGDPYTGCTQDPCNPSPCGENGICERNGESSTNDNLQTNDKYLMHFVFPLSFSLSLRWTICLPHLHVAACRRSHSQCRHHWCKSFNK